MKRGEVWWADLPLPAGRRPVLLLSRDNAYRVRNAVTVAQITRTVRKIPVEVALERQDGMPTRCAVNLVP
jgi:mRNA interferase MazF